MASPIGVLGSDGRSYAAMACSPAARTAERDLADERFAMP